ncbi:MAG TPA: hypothetical protein VLA24_14800 [Pseudomonadales bacterium]|nr:hypothetical protein [Pseudomonadales bacterium]
MTAMAALSGPQIRHAEFVKLTVGTAATVYTFCNAPAPITVGGITFTNLGALLNVGDVQRDMRSTSDDMTIALTGIDPVNVGIILGNDIKGSLVEVWRGFFDANNQIITTPTTQFFKRYQGIINSVSITEDFNSEMRTRIATCSIACSSMRRILENRLGGVKTNQSSWQFLYPGDTSMNRVATIANTYFDFGKPPQTDTQSTDTTQNSDQSGFG